MKKIISVRAQTGSYQIHIQEGLTARIADLTARLSPGNYCFLITQENILSRHKKHLKDFLRRFPHTVILLPRGEKAKSEKWLFYVLREMLKKSSIKRIPFITCLGGGVVGDLGGFAASIYKRGIPLIQIPTTLLAQVDSSIGGKTAIDLAQAKNMVGTFYQPRAVFIDPGFLSTLPQRELLQGFSEVIKYAAIRDRNLYHLLEKDHLLIKKLDQRKMIEVIGRCARIKAEIVSRDETESKGLRTLLNFGHTVGHSLESACRYSAKLSHGEAVALGMVAAANLSFNLGLCDSREVEMLYRLIRLYGLPTSFSFDLKRALDSLMHDKKFISGSVRMVLMEKVGKALVCEKIPLKSIKNSLKYLLS